LAESISYVEGHPMMLEVSESERCLRLNIPEDDDAHMVFLTLPSTALDDDGMGGPPSWVKNYNAVENHFLGQMQELTKRRTKNSALLRSFPVKPPSDVQSSMDSFLGSSDGLKTGLKVTLTNPKSTNSRTMDTHWFIPLVVNHMRRALKGPKHNREKSPLEGFMACFINENEDPVHIVVDSVMVSEGPEYDDDDKASEDVAFQGHHLSPLSDLLFQSISAATSVITEMQYMERREARMRHTAESINSRVRFFSYISIGILFVVTYIQVAYLKRYFRKKKLL